MVSSRIHPAVVVSSEIAALGVKKITLRISDGFSFLPGQYVWVELPVLKSNDVAGSRRAFSICSAPNADNTISIVARISQTGYKQSLFALDAGEAVTVHGPFGSGFMLEEEYVGDLVMIAGGVGIAPFLPIIEMCRKKSLPVHLTLIYLNTSAEQTPFLSRLEELRRNNTNFRCTVKYGHFVLDDVRELLTTRAAGQKKWMIAGPQGMVDSVYSELQKGGVSELDMAFEHYYPTRKNNLTLAAIREQMAKEGILMQAIQNSTNHTIITDANGVVLFANKAAERITGYSQEEILGNTPRLWGGLMDPKFYKAFWENKLSGKPFEGELTNRRKNGDIYYAIAHISALFGPDNEIIGFIGTEEDITKRVEIEQRVAQSENFLNSIVENLPTMVFVKDAKTFKFTLFNKAGENLLGYSRQEMLGKSDYDFFPKDQADVVVSKDKQVLAEGKAIDIPEEFIDTKNKGKRILHTRKIPIMDGQGNSQYLLGVSEDITELKENQKKLEEKNEELEKFNQIMVGRELKMIELKKQIEELTGK